MNDYPCGPGFEPAPGQSLADFLTEGAAFIVDGVTTLTAEVDGCEAEQVRSCATGAEQVAVADGYWLLLHPLSEGQHTLPWSVTVDIPRVGLLPHRIHDVPHR